MSTKDFTIRQVLDLEGEANGISIIFDGIVAIANSLEGEIAEGSGHLSTALRCMAERGSVQAEDLGRKLSDSLGDPAKVGKALLAEIAAKAR